MNVQDITIVVAADEQYIEKLHYSYQTWLHFKPDIAHMPLLLIVDESLPSQHPSLVAFQKLANSFSQKVTIRPFDGKGFNSQRAKMLTALVFETAKGVQTPWYLKLDADTFADNGGSWIEERWFDAVNGKMPAFIASPWGYTKPGNALDLLDDWGDRVEGLNAFPRLNMPHEHDSETVRSPRMASWVMFGNTQWLKEVVQYCPNERLPVPSQDTYLYYVAARRGDHYVRTKMNAYGWQHASRLASLKASAQRLLQDKLIGWNNHVSRDNLL